MTKPKSNGNPKPLPVPQKVATSDIRRNAAFFPFGQYTSVVGVHSTLLAFTALFLPRTTFFLEFTTPVPDEALMTSRDRPQHPFLVPLTLSPISTLLCICLGVLVLQAWWGGWIRNWAIDNELVGSNDEKRIDKALIQKQRVTVRVLIPLYVFSILRDADTF
jgi:phosphatidylinositol glycan class F